MLLFLKADVRQKGSITFELFSSDHACERMSEINSREKANLNSISDKNGKCYHDNKGYCKKGESCQYIHYKVICENMKCSENHCDKRHPRSCKYFQQWGYFKSSTFCKFLHESNLKYSENKKINDKLKKLKAEN